MIPAATLSARQGPVTVVADSNNTNLSTGAITAIIVVSMIVAIGLVLAVWLFRRRRAKASDMALNMRDTTEFTHNPQHSETRRHDGSLRSNRDTSYERMANVGHEGTRSVSSPHTQTSRSFELNEENLRRASMPHTPEPVAVAGINRTGRSEFALDASGSAFESIAFPDDVSTSQYSGRNYRAKNYSRPSRPAHITDIGELPTHVENKNGYEGSEFWHDGVDEVHPDQSISNMLNRRRMVRKPASAVPTKRNAKEKYIMSERDAEKKWSNEIKAEPALHSPSSTQNLSRSRQLIRTTSPLNESAEARIARLEREIANLVRGERITREAEIELVERRPSDLPIFPKERSRTADWIHMNTKPAHPTILPQIPVGNNGFDMLTDITTRSALEFPRPGESLVSAVSESACLSNDIWRQEVLKNKASRTRF